MSSLPLVSWARLGGWWYGAAEYCGIGAVVRGVVARVVISSSDSESGWKSESESDGSLSSCLVSGASGTEWCGVERVRERVESRLGLGCSGLVERWRAMGGLVDRPRIGRRSSSSVSMPIVSFREGSAAGG